MDTVTEEVKQDNVKNKEISEDNKSERNDSRVFEEFLYLFTCCSGRETVTVFPVSCIFWILSGCRCCRPPEYAGTLDNMNEKFQISTLFRANKYCLTEYILNT